MSASFRKRSATTQELYDGSGNKGGTPVRRSGAARLRAPVAITGAAVCAAMSAGLLTAALGTGVASAAVTTRYVGATAGGDTGCANPGYTSVQAAVDAASPGNTVYLCGTTPFPGQVIINKSIKLTGSRGASLGAPSPWVASADPLPPQFASDNLFVPQAIVVVWGAGVNVAIRDLTVNGTLPGNGGCAEQEFGILVIDGAAADITDDAVTNIRDSNPALYGCQFGVGIQVGKEYWPTSNFASTPAEDFTGTAKISGTAVSGYQKAGIVVDGPGSSASVSHDTVTGAGPLSALGQIIAQNGIQVSRGASGRVAGNTVSDNQYSGPGNASDGGVLIYGGCGDPLTTNVSVVGNTLTNNDVGVYLSNSDPACTAAPGTRTRDAVSKNLVTSSAVTNTSGFSTSPLCGYQAGISDVGNHDAITGNKISGAGYATHPTCTVTAPYVTYPIDTTGSIAPVVHGNS
jgi:nitrous oxidase accessory protein NosD